MNKTIYWVQIKRLSTLQHNNRQDKIIEEIERQIKNIKINKFLNVHLDRNFTKNDIKSFITFIKNKVKSHQDKIEYGFESSQQNKPIAIISFDTADTLKLDNLTLASYGDIDMINITGLSATQIKNGFIKAAGAFTSNSSKNEINIIVAEIINPHYQGIEFCEALYGTEYNQFDLKSGRGILLRQPDGLFWNADFSNKVAGIVAVFRKDHTLMSDYSNTLCTNPHLNALTKKISELIKIEKVIDQNTFLRKGFLD